MSELSHLDDSDRPRMVDVGSKAVSQRSAIAESVVELPDVIATLFDGQDIATKKGAVFQTATIAGIMAAKKTHELIPMCHPLPLEKCKLDISLEAGNKVVIQAQVALYHKTGVEMEALTAASVAVLTIYDMCKGLSQDMVIRSTRLLQKRGGKSDIDRS